MMKKTRKSSSSCNFRGVTAKQIKAETKLTKSFDLADLKYERPVKKDLAVCLVYFNCIKSKRLLMNYLYVVEKFKIAGIPTFTLEMYEDTPEIADAFHVKTDFILFQKERLCYLLEKKIPESFTKLLFIDSDLVFHNLNWYNELSEKLENFEVVQPFSKGVWLDITYKKIVKVRVPIAFYKHLGNINNSGGIGGYHPGFAWGFQRDWYRRIGFFQYGILGCGDTLSSTVIMNYDNWNCSPYMTAALDVYKQKFTEAPSVCFLNGVIYHLWHGDQKNRQYSDRRDILASVKDIRDIIKVENNGLFALKDDTFKKRIRKYFTNRFDDGLEIP